MDRSTPIYLVTEYNQEDEFGVLQPMLSKRLVFANVTSVTSREWMEGGRIGLNPEFRMTMFAFDYAGEKVLVYNGSVYSIYRTYIGPNDTIELYVQRKQGTRQPAGGLS